MRYLTPVALLAAIHLGAAAPPNLPAGLVVWAIPEAMHLIRTADEIYIIPVTLTEDRNHVVTPAGDYKHRRRLTAGARRKLVHLLANESNWFHGLDDTVSINSSHKNVGFIFRRGKEELVLLCGLGSSFGGVFKGETTGGSLEDKPSAKLDEWKKEYAKPELANK